jgi:hypothetical protein
MIFCQELFIKCNTRQSVCRVHKVLCGVPLTLDKEDEFSSVTCFGDSLSTMNLQFDALLHIRAFPVMPT